MLHKMVKASNIHLPLYAWGAAKELEASLSGRGQAMSEDMMLGKLRHFINTMEVGCINSSATDFTTYGWVVAKD